MSEVAGSEIEARIAELREQIAYHNRRYHELDDPEMPDDVRSQIQEIQEQLDLLPPEQSS